ncbi:MAG: HNH endonuclease [Longimicrobiales bacterium]
MKPAQIERRRDRIFRRDAYRCVYCGDLHEPSGLTLDHVQPRVKGGDHSDGNLVTCCIRCNEAKAGEAAWSFLARHPELRDYFLEHALYVWPRIRLAVEEAARKTR